MLIELDIKNFATIKTLTIHFKDQMTVLLGETGAGKSILVDALSLLLGHRAQAEMIRTGEQKATVTGLFALGKEKRPIAQVCDDYGLPLDDDQLVISRAISIRGRNLIRVNGQLTTMAALRSLGVYLVDMHGQDDHQLMMRQDQLQLLDRFAGSMLQKPLKAYRENYEQWYKLTQQLTKLQKNAQALAQKQDVLRFQNEELQEAHLQDSHEDERLSLEYQKLKNFQKIADTVNLLIQLFDDDEQGIATLLGTAQQNADELVSYGTEFKNMVQSLSDGIYSLNDFRSQLGSIVDDLDFDDAHFQEVYQRLETLNQLKKKYGPTLKDVLNFSEKVKKTLNQFDAGSFDEDQIKAQLTTLTTVMTQQAHALHDLRQKTAIKLEQAVKQELADLYMNRARFSIRFNHSTSFLPNGHDQASFYIATNPGEDLMPLVKVISGGEQSRLVLALKVIFSHEEPVKTMIFDEIDTGVSGRVAAAIGQKMQNLAGTKQVIVITHSPQVAAAGDHYQKVDKVIENRETFTRVKALRSDEAIRVIAQMISGKAVTEVAEKSAENLWQQSQRQKK